MKFDDLLSLVGDLSHFDLATLVQLTDERRGTLTNQLYRFSRAGKIVPLRRGMYVLAERYRRTAVQPAELAGTMYRPSYLSGPWALSYYGLIPEGVPVFTSVTTRSPKRFDNVFGSYLYRHVQLSLFFGYSPVDLGGRLVSVASPEKALVDYWYLEAGEWTEERMRQLRLAVNDSLDRKKLFEITNQTSQPRLLRAFERWERVAAEGMDGEIDL
jgi:predicted transcriptional regulator of viral defense system